VKVLNTAIINDIKLCYYDNLNLNHPPIIFIHGLGENLHSWKHQIQFFNLNYRVVAMDLRGHGATTDGNKKISIEQFVEDLIAFLDYLNISQAHFVGLSLGGMICQQLTHLHQSRILSLVLANTSAFPTDMGNFPLSVRLEFVKNTPIDVLANFITKNCLPKNNYSPNLYAEILTMFSDNRSIPYLAATAVAFSFDFRDKIDNIKVRTLIIVGEYDVVTPVWAAQFLQQHITNSTLVVISNAGHLTKLEQPQQFNQTVNNFLNLD
jgi:pimeloyl-ACP methyl ester carboxylesterase